jgi:uncharacterized membrane protein
MDGLLELIGRLHPALVHLPIGILILAVLFVWLDHSGRIKISVEVLRLSLGLGAVCAILSCITGLLLSREGEYDIVAVRWHQWMGITTAVVSIMVWRIAAALLRWTSTLMLLLLIVTGHLGASLTHGSSYLLEPIANQRKAELDLSAVNYDSAKAYADVVAPIFQQHCYACHGPDKQKGKLRLDEPGFILTGSKNGAVINAGNPQESELMERLRLPVGDEHHMPPKEKAQPDQRRLNLIAHWIEAGASFDLPLKDVVSRQSWSELISVGQFIVVDDIPDRQVQAPDERVIDELISAGVSVSPVSMGSNYLQLNFAGVTHDLKSVIETSTGLAPNVIWLRIGNTNLNDSLMTSIRQFKNLTRLGLERTSVTDAGIENLKGLESLAVLNLGGTAVSMDGLTSISNLKNIRTLNLYQTQIRPQLAEPVRKLFPNAEIEFGEYQVQTLPTDTLVVGTH